MRTTDLTRPQAIVLLVALSLWGCTAPKDPWLDDTPTSGQVLILADEDLRALVEAERSMFEAIYAKARLHVRYLPESALLKALHNDSVRCYIGAVRPGADEQAWYDARNVKAHVVPIATDGIAVVVNKDCGLTPPTVQDLRELLTGEHERSGGWGACDPSAPTATQPTAVVAGRGSGVARALVDSLLQGSASALRAQAGASVDSVMALVARDTHAIGLIPFSAISDLDDTAMVSMRQGIRILPVARVPGSPAVMPTQSTLADGSYPLRRPVYMVLAEGKSGLGTGFVSFVANHKGQRIILKHGIAPNKVPPRDIQVVAP